MLSPSLTEIERQRKRHRSRRSAETRQHHTTKRHVSATTTCTTTPPDVATYVAASSLVPPPPCLGGGITRVGPGQYPQYTRALARGRLWVARRSVTTAQPRRDNRRAQQSSRDDEVPHFQSKKTSIFLTFKISGRSTPRQKMFSKENYNNNYG